MSGVSEQASMIIAVDGPAASGKGTISRHLAAHFRLGYLDTGKLYRAVGARMLAGEDPVAAAQTLGPDALDDPALHDGAVAQAASRVAAMPEVRAALLAFQRDYAARDGGAVLDGRDIGTVICPDAPVKLFVTASAEARARRRYEELSGMGYPVRYETVLADIEARDSRDSERSEAPLRAADDALLMDTSAMGVEEAQAAAVGLVERRLADLRV
jgi:cytidylate kinase